MFLLINYNRAEHLGAVNWNKATYLVTPVIAPKGLTNCQDDFFRLILCERHWHRPHSKGLQFIAGRLHCDYKGLEAWDERRGGPLERTKGLSAD